MTESTESRVAVYIDFDNIVISRYNQLHGVGQWQRDKARSYTATRARSSTGVGARLEEATVDISAVLDFASSFGTIVISRAYADWSVPVNASYQKQLIDKAIDLTQLFPTVQSMKNGADIRLAVDVVEDMFRLGDLTHVVIVAGDSDYIALAQRAKRLGRYVVGIGVAGGTSKALAAACDEFADYDALPGISGDAAGLEVADEPAPPGASKARVAASAATAETATDGAPAETTASSGTSGGEAQKAQKSGKGARRATSKDLAAKADTADTGEQEAPGRPPTALLVRAIRLGQSKQDADWLNSSSVKNQMLRMDPSFNEGALGFSSFTDFVKSRGNIVEIKEDGQARLIRLRPGALEK
ncbi:NYN domain-containing protein [Microbacterium sp. STN6]|uniref:NYN domain-containing protein n=1 Tax=Microbacterium sp. STN6 TaxID=2995588 RepID=UPI002260E3CB|nr:NYN domain-containing protein [Microbacterium sp. STN6]MCX7520659.1 NYN domain-containing protein [Microbacterium sp. STN6]